MSELTTTWIIHTIEALEKMEAHLNESLSNRKQELYDSLLYRDIIDLETSLKQLEQQKLDAIEAGKDLMISNGLKKFEALNWTIIQLNETPWALIIENEKIIPKEYIKEKITKTIDKKQLKEDIKEWLILEWVSIKKDYNLVIKYKNIW